MVHQIGVVALHGAVHLAVGRLDETVFVHRGIGSQAADQADVRAFRGFDGANTAIVAKVHVAHVKAGAFTAQTAGTQGAHGAFVAQFRKRVGFFHKLAQLAAAEEFAQAGNQGPDVHQGDRRNGGVLIADGHALFDHAFHTAQANAQLVLDELANGFYAAVAQMVNIIRRNHAVVDLDHPLHQAHDVPLGDHAMVAGHDFVQVQLLVELVAANALQVVMARVKDLLDQVVAGVIQRWGFTRAQALVKLDHRGLGDGVVGAGVVLRLLFEGVLDVGMLGVVIHIGKERQNLFVRAGLQGVIGHAVIHRCQGAQEYSDRHRALAVELKDDKVVLTGFELHPRAAVRDQLAGGHITAGGAVHVGFKIHAGAADQLGYHHTLRTVDDEGTLLGHFREISQEEVLLYFFGDVIAFQQNRDIERAGVGKVPLQAFLDGVLGGLKPVFQVKFLRQRGVAGEMQAQVPAVRLNRRDLVEKRAQPFVFQAFKGF